GAMETMTDLHRSRLVRKYTSALADAAYVMGSEQIRNRATVGSNVANSSPAADTPAPLAALAARAVTASAAGERALTIEEVLGRNKNRLAAGEIIK
ncbi:FAD binding domain-containing protein, partial [Cloacibacillus evryensis]|uniref:FAD binding domain-containing protein n=1 Tax=Cloacibacillus evryensis TaxID=508460 RepID=UPI00210D2BFE